MMVLAVNIVGDGAANRHKFRAWRDWQEPTAWDDNFQQIAQCDAGFNPNSSAFPVKIEDAIYGKTIQQFATVIQARVAIAAAKSIGQQRTGLSVAQKLW